ncbi:FAD-dependent oxidoreductase [Jhaorihella thermophila]
MPCWAGGRGRALIDTLGEMPARVFDLIDRYGIDCEATRTGTIHAAHSPKGFDDLARRAEGWAELGAPVDLLDARQTAEKTGTTRFFGGLLDHRAGMINPMGYARGLARAAATEGAAISTRSPVRRLDRQGDCWRLVTDRGTVTARRVVLATNAYTDDLWPGLRRTFTMIHFFQVATEPLGERAATILPERQGLWDTAPVMLSLRRDAFGRLVIGSMGAVLGGGAGLSRRWAARTLARLFPDLGPVGFQDAWHGQIAMTPDHLFRIHRLADGLYTPPSAITGGASPPEPCSARPSPSCSRAATKPPCPSPSRTRAQCPAGHCAPGFITPPLPSTSCSRAFDTGPTKEKAHD